MSLFWNLENVPMSPLQYIEETMKNKKFQFSINKLSIERAFLKGPGEKIQANFQLKTEAYDVTLMAL